MDWRPREFNSAADHVANCTLKAAEDIDSIQLTNCRDAVALQVYCDGGYALGNGAAAFVITCVKKVGANFETVVLGARGCWIQTPRSAFQTEVAALDFAAEFLANNFHQ